MKKIISILCIVALLVTSLGMSLISAVATTSSNVTVPQNVSTSATQVENTSPLPLSTLYKTDTGNKSVSFDPVSANNAGVMFYVEAPENDTSLKFAVYLWSDTNNMWHARYSSSSNSAYNWYYYDSELGFWSPVVVDQYGVYLPANYKGYVYMSTASLVGLSDASKVFTEADTISKAYIYGTDSTGGELVFSAPLFVSGDNQATTAPAFNSVVLDEVEYSLNTIDTNPVYEGDTVIMPSFVDEIGLAFYPEATSKLALPSTVASSNVTVAENTTGLPVDVLFNIPDAQSSRLYVDPVRGAGTTGLMMYVEAPVTTDGSDYKFYAYYGIIDSETGKKGCYMSNAHHTFAQYAAKGSSYWKTQGTALGDHSVWLPSGFKGYLYIPFNTLSNVSGNGVGSYTENDIITEVWFLNTDRTNVGNDQYLKVSAPILTKGTFAERTRPINSLVWHGDTYLLDGSGLVEEDPDYVKPSFATSFNTAVDFNSANNVPGDANRGYEELTYNLNPLSNHPSYVYDNMQATMTNSYGFLANYVTSSYTYTAGTQFDGFLVYVDVSANKYPTIPAHLNMQIAANVDGSGWSCPINGYRANTTFGKAPAVYLLWDDGEKGTTWEKRLLPTTSPATDNTYGSNYQTPQGVILPVGFKGYVYVPNTAFAYDHSSQSIKNLKIGITSGLNDATVKYFVSAPVAFKKDFGFDPDAKPSNTVINGPAAVIDLDTNEKISAGFDSYSKPETYDGKADIAVDSSLIPSVKPLTLATNFGTYVDHPLNQRSSAEDYGAGKLWNGLAVGGSAFKIDNVYSADVTTVFTDCMIDNLPAFRVDANADLPGDRQYYQFIPASSKLTVEKDSGVMFYIKNESAESKYFRVLLTTPKSTTDTTQDNTFNSVNVGNSRLLAKGETSWEKVSAHENGEQYINIEAGFEGYIFVDFESKALMSTLLGSENAYISGIAIYSDLNKDDSFTISTPLLVENFADDYNEPLAIVNGAEAAQNLLNGKFALPFDNNGNMKLDILDLVYNKANSSNTYFMKNYYRFRDYVDSEVSVF